MRRHQFASVAVLLTTIALFSGGAVAADPATNNPSAKLAALGMKFEGAGTCSGNKCHGMGDSTVPPTKIGSEFNIWAEKDAHAGAFDALEKPHTDRYPESKYPNIAKIGTNLGIKDVTTSTRCTVCHTVEAPKNLHGEKFTVKEGNSCASCHGPSEKWREPHATVGWTAAERKASSHDDLLKKWGLYDTKPVVKRAEMCVGCHLTIDHDLVAAGHPQPTFELDYFQELENKHWKDPEGYFTVKLWAAGQVVAMRDSMNQLATRAGGGAKDDAVKDAFNQAVGHWMMVNKAFGGGISGDALVAAMKANDKAALAKAAAAAAGAATALLPTAEKFEADKAKCASILNAVAGEDVTAYGIGGVEQQVYAIYSLYGAYSRNEKLADAEATGKLIEKLFEPMDTDKVDPATYKPALDAVKAKLPK